MAIVTDHAVLRYLERHHGVDVEGFRDALAVGAIDIAAGIRCDTVKLGCGCRLKLCADRAVTCLGHTKRHPRRQPRSPQ